MFKWLFQGVTNKGMILMITDQRNDWFTNVCFYQ
jgi:hypothetical protein